MNTKLNLNKVYEVIKSLINNQMRVIIFIIVGSPDETVERFESGLRFLRKIKALGGDVTVLPNIT